MKRIRAALAGALVLVITASAQAHRLDEYLQETLIELTPQRIVLHVDLTAGVDVAPAVLSSLDSDHDGNLSEAEQSDYTEKVRRDLTVTLNDAPMAIRTVEKQYPTVDAMKRGLGAITLTFEAPLPPDPGKVTLQLDNHHDATMASYLVNCLMPRSPDIRVLSQSRSRDQAHYQAAISFDAQANPPRALRSSLPYVALSLGGALLLWRLTRASARAQGGGQGDDVNR